MIELWTLESQLITENNIAINSYAPHMGYGTEIIGECWNNINTHLATFPINITSGGGLIITDKYQERITIATALVIGHTEITMQKEMGGIILIRVVT